jgi:thiol-disulfide isomerase/thioredoxin
MKLFAILVGLFSFINMANISDVELKPAPDFDLISTEGNRVKLDDLKGKVILLEFWFVRCPGCKSSIPFLNKLQRKYPKDKLEVIGIEYMNANKGAVVDYVKNNRVNYTTLLFGKTVAARYDVFGGPTFALIDQNGTIVYDAFGLNEFAIMEAIDGLL